MAEFQVWCSEIDEVVTNPGDLSMLGESGAVVIMGDADERMNWLKKVAWQMDCEVKPVTPEYDNDAFVIEKADWLWRAGLPADYDPKLMATVTPERLRTVDAELFDLLRKDQTIHWMGKPE